MSSVINQNFYQRLLYGFTAKIFKDSIFLPVTLYLDTLYDNFLWISTDNNSFLIDLVYAQIRAYSLELEIAIKEESNYQGQQLPKYIIIKQLNTEVAVLFEEKQKFQSYVGSRDKIASERFIIDKKPVLYGVLEKYIEEKKGNLGYSANFSRIFKSMRLKMEEYERQKSQSFRADQLISILDKIQYLNSVDKKQYIQKKQQNFSSLQALNVLKVIYCRQNLLVLKLFYKNQLISSFRNSKDFIQVRILCNQKLGDKQMTCFDILMTLENDKFNYLIPQRKVNEDLCLVDYFCFSSHNTYLTGNQLTSDSKVTRYLEDLKKGLKCVQLDVHNQGGNQPIITHAIAGKGLCKPISFRRTIQVMDQYLQAFPRHYPVILSIQNHASRENQDLMNNILVKQFPTVILTPKNRDQFPKLSQCKGKIIVKTSCDLQTLAQFKNNQQAPKTSKLYKTYSKQLQQFQQQARNHRNQFQFSARSQSKIFDKQVEQDNQNNINIETQNPDYKAFMNKISKIKRLKEEFNKKIDQTSYLPVEKIVQITCMFKTQKGIQTVNPSTFQCTSIVNKKIVKLNKEKVIDFTKRSWVRSYPQGTQIHSKNYQFLELLARGVQIIALNTQTNDDYCLMMNSYFRAGQRGSMQSIGYIEKPQHLRRSNLNNQLNITLPLKQFNLTFYTHYSLQFTLYSLQNASVSINNVSQNQKRIKFKLSHYNQSFLVIKIDNKKYIECIPLRFLPYQQNGILYRTLIGRDYQFQDCGIRILVGFQCKNSNSLSKSRVN